MFHCLHTGLAVLRMSPWLSVFAWQETLCACGFESVWSSVTKFGKILILAQNRKKCSAIFWEFILFLAYFKTYFDKIMYAIGHIFVDVNGQKLKNNLVIWSHWWWRERYRKGGNEWYSSFMVGGSFRLADAHPSPLPELCSNYVFADWLFRRQSKQWRWRSVRPDWAIFVIPWLQIFFKSSPNNWWLFGPFLKMAFLNRCWVYLGNYWKNWATFNFNIWSHRWWSIWWVSMMSKSIFFSEMIYSDNRIDTSADDADTEIISNKWWCRRRRSFLPGKDNKKYWLLFNFGRDGGGGGGGGQVVSVLPFYSDNPSTNPVKVYNFYYVKINWIERRGRNWPFFLKKITKNEDRKTTKIKWLTIKNIFNCQWQINTGRPEFKRAHVLTKLRTIF